MKKVLIIFIAFVILGLISKLVSTPTKDKTQPEPAEVVHNIAGANPVDIYLNLEKKGFKIDKQFGSGICSWMCTKNESGLSYIVSVVSEEPTKINEVKITASIDASDKGKLIVAAKPFIKWVSSFPYDGQDVQKLASWIENNYNTNGASTTIGNAKFTLSAPNKFTRQLNVNKV